MKDPFGCLRGAEISPEIAKLKLAELRFGGPPDSIKHKLEKLASWGISEELVGEKIVKWFSSGLDLRLVRLNVEKLLSFEELSPETVKKRFSELHLCPSTGI